jgi:hypothetical protein
LTSSEPRTYPVRVWRALITVALFLAGGAFLAVAATRPAWLGPVRTLPARTALALAPAGVLIALGIAATFAAWIVRGPARVSDEGVYNPCYWRARLRRVLWRDVVGIRTRQVGEKYTALVLELAEGGQSTVPLSMLANADGFVTDVMATWKAQHPTSPRGCKTRPGRSP